MTPGDKYHNRPEEIIKSLPNKPGVYQYFDREGTIIYIGKAKNLKKRVSSYFQKQHENRKISIMVKKIHDIKHIVVNTESDALLLENNLIKKYQPRYNVNLKDDKTFPWIVIKNERFPRVFMTRNYIKDGSEYFGPYTSVVMVKTILNLIKKLYNLRNCKLNLSREKIDKQKYKVCLEFHIGNCLGPCVRKQSEEDYNESINKIRKILKGNLQEVTVYLKSLMKEYAEEYRFEEASFIKEKIDNIEKFKNKSTVVNPSINNLDVYSIADDEKAAYVNFIKVANGAIIQANTVEIKKKLNESRKELLEIAIVELNERMNSNAKEILVPFEMDIAFENKKFVVPKIGDKKKLMELSERNVKYYQADKKKQHEKSSYDKRAGRVLSTVKADLRMNEMPHHIECFDNSNIQGSNPVASCVVFKDAKPKKSMYRHFNIKTVTGPDDFASMKEVIFRRYKRLTEEKQSLPQLIVIDGGKGQLNMAVKSLEELGLQGKITIIGIAKKLEEIYFPGDQIPIYLDKNSETLRLIQHLRNEAHRFGISFHRDKRSKAMLTSGLDTIKGIGPKTKEMLLSKYKSLNNIKKAPLKEMEDLIGKNKAKIVQDYLKASDETP